MLCDTCIHHYKSYCLMGEKPNKCTNYFAGVCRVKKAVLEEYIKGVEEKEKIEEMK